MRNSSLDILKIRIWKRDGQWDADLGVNLMACVDTYMS